MTEEQEALCDQEITEKEILENVKNGKCPGTSGLSADFYKSFWVDIQKVLTETILYTWTTFYWTKKRNYYTPSKKGQKWIIS